MKHILKAQNTPGRLDAFIVEKIPGISRSKAQKMIASGHVLLEGRQEKPSYKISPGETVTVFVPEEPAGVIKPQRIDLDVIYEDEHVMVVNKPAGMITHPTESVRENTLVNALLGYTDKLSSVNGPFRRGIVHRLDKDTTGVLIIAKTDSAHLELARQIGLRTVKRIYRALVMGSVEPPRGEISAPIGRHSSDRVKMSVRYLDGREAVTRYEVIRKFFVRGETFSFLRVSLKTGRTHQIRVHFSSVGYPVCGDPKYGKKSHVTTISRQALHAAEVGFSHPDTGENVHFSAPVPDDFQKQLDMLVEASGSGPGGG